MKRVLLGLFIITTLLSACAKKQLKVDDVVGTYVRNYQEEMGEEFVNLTDKIVLRNDMTCTLQFQDFIDGTWTIDGNIQTNSSTDKFEIKNDKLIFTRSDDGLKLEFIKEERQTFTLCPLYKEIDMFNPEDGIYYVTYDKNGISKNENGETELECKIYSEDIYDAVEVLQMQDGDVLINGGGEEKLDKIIWNPAHNELTAGVDSWDDWIWALSPNDQGGTYFYHGLDDHHSYTERGIIKLPIDESCVFIDTSEVDNSDGEVNFIEKKISSPKDIVSFIENDEYQNFIYLNSKLRVENGKIVEMWRKYIP